MLIPRTSWRGFSVQDSDYPGSEVIGRSYIANHSAYMELHVSYPDRDLRWSLPANVVSTATKKRNEGDPQSTL